MVPVSLSAVSCARSPQPGQCWLMGARLPWDLCRWQQCSLAALLSLGSCPGQCAGGHWATTCSHSSLLWPLHVSLGSAHNSPQTLTPVVFCHVSPELCHCWAAAVPVPMPPRCSEQQRVKQCGMAELA